MARGVSRVAAGGASTQVVEQGWVVVGPRPHAGATGHAVVDLIGHARTGMAEAAATADANERYVAAHLAALRAGAAVLAARANAAGGRERSGGGAGGNGIEGRRGGRSRGGRSRGPRNVWVDLARVAPELAEWADFFAASAAKRGAAQAGLPHAVTAREADDLLREADTFLGQVCLVLGVPHQPPISGLAVGLSAG